MGESEGKAKARAMPATELRIHLGEVLRSLDDGDVIVEKGGVPVAVLRRWQGRAGRAPQAGGAAGGEMDIEATGERAASGAYAAALSRRARPDGLARALAAMDRGWAGLDADALRDSVYGAREAGASDRHFTLAAESGAEDEDDGEIPGGQRHLYRRARRPERKVADGPGEGYSS